MALSAVAIRNAKARDKAYKLTDGDGLYLMVMPSGARYWRMNYRFLGKQKTLAFGVWPDTGLAEARERRDHARRLIAQGEDPAERVKLDRIAATVAAANSFKAVADEWLVKMESEGRAPITMKKLRWLTGFINASIGTRPIASISAHELLVMLRKMESQGKYETAKRLRSTCSKIFRFAIATARADRDVAADLGGALIAPRPVHRPAITTEKAAGALLRAIEGFDGHPDQPRWRFAFSRMCSCALGSFATPNGRSWTSPTRNGGSRLTRRRCAARISSLCRGRRSRSLVRSSMMRRSAAIYFLPSGRSTARCPKIRSVPHCGTSAMLRTN
jgi:hypothetical protein